VRQKSFTLFEIIIALILVSIFYYFAIHSFSSGVNVKEEKVSLLNLKKQLFKLGFSQEITIKCINEKFNCFVYLDGELQDDMLDPLFVDTPKIYEYNQNAERVEFMDLELEQLERYEIVFEFTCKKNKKCDELIVETEDLVYLFHNFSLKPYTLEYMGDIDEFFEKRIREVQDAI
jgi:hypothetical protein